jgi:hypothetical protein
VIEEIMELMLRSAETASEERLSRKEAAAAAAAESSSNKQNGADGKLQIFVWDPGGFPTLRGEAHEQELMILQLRSLMQEHLSTSASQPASHVSECKFKAKREAQPHLKFEIECN